MATVESFEELEIWQNARKIANAIYDLSDSGPFSHDFGLKDQMRRAAVSVMSNISEGFESSTQKTFINYLGHAKASAGELRVCSRQIQTLIRYLQSQPNVRRVREDGVEYETYPSTFN